MSCRIREELMNLSEMIGTYSLAVYAPPADGEIEVEHGYASDLLSDVIANAGKDCVWVTIVIVSNHKPADDTIKTAKQKGVCVLGTGMTTFETCGRLYTAGIREGGG
jgi:hypothetical protein